MLVAAKCTQCGANLEVEASNEAAVCKFCGAAFITEKAVNNFNIGNIQANVVNMNIYGNAASDFETRGGRLTKCNSSSSKVIIPDDVAVIGKNVFLQFGITEAVLPSGLVAIEENAFYLCKHLRKINIPEGVTTIEEYAFYGCNNLSEIEISDANWEKFKLHFGGSPYFKSREPNEYEKISRLRRAAAGGICVRCGGTISGTIFPRCVQCGKSPRGICLDCGEPLVGMVFPTCPKCGKSVNRRGLSL